MLATCLPVYTSHPCVSYLFTSLYVTSLCWLPVYQPIRHIPVLATCLPAYTSHPCVSYLFTSLYVTSMCWLPVYQPIRHCRHIPVLATCLPAYIYNVPLLVTNNKYSLCLWYIYSPYIYSLYCIYINIYCLFVRSLFELIHCLLITTSYHVLIKCEKFRFPIISLSVTTAGSRSC